MQENEIKTEAQDCYSANSFLHIKGYLAIFVLLHHIFQFTELLHGSNIGYALNMIGHLSVVEFTFMSGFGVWSSYLKKGDAYINGFVKNRLLPFYFTYVFFVVIYAVYALIMGSEINTGIILHSLTYGGTVVSFGWFFQAIFLLYLIFYLCVKYVKKDSLSKVMLILGVTVIVLLCFIFKLPKNTYAINVSFLVGIVFADNSIKRSYFYKKRTGTVLLVSMFIFVGLSLCATLMDYKLTDTMKGFVLLDFSYLIVMILQDIAFAVFIFYLIYCISCLEKKILINPISFFLGKHSLEIYALQGIILGTLRIIIENNLLYAMVSIILVLDISVPVHGFINALKMRFKKE